jgi:hypothetical protein
LSPFFFGLELIGTGMFELCRLVSEQIEMAVGATGKESHLRARRSMDVIAEAIKTAVREVIDERAASLAESSRPRLMSIDKAAAYFDCSPGHIRNLIAAGILPAVRFKIAGTRNKPYVDRRDLDRLIDEN